MVLRSKGDNLKCALEWISEQRISKSSESVYQLVEKASVRFDLDPKQTEYLLRNTL